MDNQPTNPKQAILDRLHTATNILVTVSNNPTVDELASCLGLTLWLNKIDKHATAVFSGEVPSTLEFLQPADTLEKNTDSLRDFIISLDKSKADKLRYKVEDSVVKIFITPYRTSLSASDLEYSQGDFNVDMVIALGVADQQDLDTAITSHGRILHDATVATITTDMPSELGSLNWNDGQASSLSELVTELGNAVGKDHLDSQIATALLTGIVAETARFSNEKTTPQTMSVSAELMAAGANQQLVASKLENPAPAADTSTTDESTDRPADEAPAPEAGTLEIEHEEQPEAEAEPVIEEATSEPKQEPEAEPEPMPTPEEEAQPEAPAEPEQPEAEPHVSKLVTEPPTMGGTLTANSRPDDIMLEPSSDAFSLDGPQDDQPLMSRSNEQPIVPHDQPDLPLPPPAEPVDEESQPEPVAEEPAFVPPTPAAPSWMPSQPWLDNQQSAAVPAPTDDQPVVADDHDEQTLAEIEQSVDSPHADQPAADNSDVDSARDEVMKAINAVPDASPEPVQALNATAIDLNQPAAAPVADQPWAPAPAEPAQPLPLPTPAFANTQFDPASFEITNDAKDPITTAAAPTAVDPDLTTPVEQPFTMPLPGSLAPPAANPIPPTSTVEDPTAPPPVPPPLMPPGFPTNQ